jgi:hypothetical protein
MDVDGIFRVPPKFLYGQVLLDPFEEDLYLPPVAVQFGDFESGHFHVVGQEKKIDIAWTYFPEFMTVILTNRQNIGQIKSKNQRTLLIPRV